ncbi:MAG: DUF3772 domain-containing protein, partial [Hyphococcus sp.]
MKSFSSLVCILAGVVLFFIPPAALAQDNPAAGMEDAQKAYAQARQEIQSGDIEDPDALEASLRALREQSRQRLGEVERALTDVQAQIDLLGPPPAEGAPPETEELASLRSQLNTRLGELSSQRVTINANIATANELLGEIATSRVSGFYDRLLQRGPSPLSPALWTPALDAASSTADKISSYFQNWSLENKRDENLGRSIALITAALGLSLFLFWPVNRWVMSTFSAAIEEREPTPARRVVVAGLKMIARTAPGVIG